MPTYAYACTACEHRFEVQQSFSDDALTECPECQGKLRKLFNSVGIVFKGSGFYRTDSRNGKTGGDAAAGSSSTSSSESSGSSGSSGGSAAPTPAAASSSGSNGSSSPSTGSSPASTSKAGSAA